MNRITPIILAKSKEEFKEKIENKELRKVADVWQVDVLDRTLVDSDSWADPMNVDDIDLPDVELHLMVTDPVAAVEDWDDMTSSVRRAIVQAEMLDPRGAIEEIKGMQVECGLAIAPETGIETIEDVKDLIETVLILGVEPGASGQQFLGDKILKKIQQTKEKYPDLEIAVDGGINETNAVKILKAGADRLCVASAIWKSDDPVDAFRKLKSL